MEMGFTEKFVQFSAKWKGNIILKGRGSQCRGVEAKIYA
jgi:hypothetical protein